MAMNGYMCMDINMHVHDIIFMAPHGLSLEIGGVGLDINPNLNGFCSTHETPGLEPMQPPSPNQQHSHQVNHQSGYHADIAGQAQIAGVLIFQQVDTEMVNTIPTMTQFTDRSTWGVIGLAGPGNHSESCNKNH